VSNKERPGSIKNRKSITQVRRKTILLKSQITVLPSGKDIVDVIMGEPGRKVT